MVVGADYAPSGNNTEQGAAYVFTKPSSGWASNQYTNQTAILGASDGAANDYFGISVAISGNTVVAGASGNNSRAGGGHCLRPPATA